MIVLADLCMQYTALVDSHIPKLAACIRDPSEFVRRQGLALLANLLSKVQPISSPPQPLPNTPLAPSFPLPGNFTDALIGLSPNVQTHNQLNLSMKPYTAHKQYILGLIF